MTFRRFPAVISARLLVVAALIPVSLAQIAKRPINHHDYDTQSRIGGSIWQYPTRFIENSPIFWADRVQTPVMMLHNDGDDAVPWYQGIEYYLALRRLGKEVYLFVYNGEPHGLRMRANQKDYSIRLQQYFDHYLKGAPAPEWMTKGVPYIDREKTALSELGPAQ